MNWHNTQEYSQILPPRYHQFIDAIENLFLLFFEVYILLFMHICVFIYKLKSISDRINILNM